jgi:hypothetical protein
MSRRSCLTVVILGSLLAAAVAPLGASAQRDRQRPPEREAVRRPPPPPVHPPHRPPSVVVRGRVFIGGYFYDPFFGPYPWWPRTSYPYWYFPLYDDRAEVSVKVKPNDAAVYVDGFYAGVVDDFDGIFQPLPLTPGGHTIVLYLEGYRTARHSVYLRPASSFKLRDTLVPLPPGEQAEPPDVAPPVPPPPTGSYGVPSRTAPVGPRPVPRPPDAAFGTLDIVVQPATATVAIDGRTWQTSEPGHFVIQLPPGRHRVDINASGYRAFATEVEVRDTTTAPLNVSLTPQP